ncbi:MAG: hypothetical protein ABRQ32_07975, partial [Smithellaceae bacterium]
PRIVLFDEPTSGQDPVRKNAILTMIAQYQRKFGFTAILVSHEIPDVYFISNRILALYDRQIVFQGTPEELENFDHPFKDEVIYSLEALQKELSGLYSKRQFEILNRVQMKRKEMGEKYCVIIFALEELNEIIAKLGHDAAQEAIHAMGLYVDKHFGSLGGFSTRHRLNEFITMVPYSELGDIQVVLQDFIKDFQEKGNNEIWALYRKLVPPGQCVDLSILAGVAQGRPFDEIDSVIESARAQQKEIGRLRCIERRREKR